MSDRKELHDKILPFKWCMADDLYDTVVSQSLWLLFEHLEWNIGCLW